MVEITLSEQDQEDLLRKIEQSRQRFLLRCRLDYDLKKGYTKLHAQDILDINQELDAFGKHLGELIRKEVIKQYASMEPESD